MNHTFYPSLCLAAACFLFSCAKQVTKVPKTSQAETVTSVQPSPKPLDYIKKMKKDTLTYIVGFPDSLDRSRFAGALEKLIKEFPPKATDDSTREKFIKAQAVVTAPTVSESVHVQPSFAFPVPQAEAPSAPIPTAPAGRYGGSASLYSPFGASDRTMAAFMEAFLCKVESCPSNGRDSVAAFCEIRQLSDKKVVLTISAIAKNAMGKGYSAFDVVSQWSGYVKQHPAEGRALFRYVSGIDQFIAGREAVVPGFQVNSEKTVILQLSQTDPLAAQRLCTPRLFPAAFKAGPYFIKNSKDNVVQLAPNDKYRFGKPFLGACEIRFGKDNNPFLAFSLNRYDVVALYALKDIDYARRAFADKATLRPFTESRYFLSLALGSPDLRGALCRLFDRKDILANYVKAEGTPLAALETPVENPEPAAPTNPALNNIPGGLAAAPVVVLFQSDDPVSVVVADKLLADISRAGISCTVKGVSTEEYEKALVRRDYGIAVGCVPGSVLTDQSERLRLSTMWFNDETNESARIESKQEFPLFSIKTYLLCKEKVEFLNDAVEGIYLKE